MRENFLWGAATSAHQVEGNNYNDWTDWEKNHAPIAAAQAQAIYDASRTVWEDQDRESTKIKNYISGNACDHYHRFEEDFDFARSLSMNAHRFSIEWSRIEPEEGKFDEKEIKHYHNVILALKKRGIQPCVTLWHYTLPVWFINNGGWTNRIAPDLFCRFIDRVVREFKDDVTVWFTMNEPELYARRAYLLGDRPPEKKSVWQFLLVTNRIIHAHRQAYRRIKQIDPLAKVGVAKDVFAFTLSKPTWLNKLALSVGQWIANRFFFNMIRNEQDFLGLNYYINYRIDMSLPGRQKFQDSGWEHTVEGLPWLVHSLAHYRKPFLITENGTVDYQDEHRGNYITNMLQAMQTAKKNGVNITGYFHWSLLDNFEWDKGFYLRFGLINVDRKTLKRTVRPSAHIYSRLIANALKKGRSG